MLPCNDFAENTVQTTQQQVDCLQMNYELSNTGLDEIPFLLAVNDWLERLNIGPSLATISSQGLTCDAVQALRNVTCAMQPITSPGTEDPTKLQAIIALRLNNAGCA